MHPLSPAAAQRASAPPWVSRGLYGVGVLAILATGWRERLRLPPLPFVDGDFRGYLKPAVDFLVSGELGLVGSREFLYPAFVAGILGVFRDFDAVATAQHAIGLGTGLVLLAAWQRIPLPERSPPWIARLRAVLGLVLLAAQQWLAQSIVYEHMIRPEAVVQLPAALLLLGSVELARRQSGEPGLARRLMAAAMLVVASGFALATLRPQTLLVVPLALAWVLLMTLRLGSGLRVASVTLGLPLALAVVLFVLPNRWLGENDPQAGRFMPGVVLFWHFDHAAPLLREDLAANAFDPALAETVTQVLGAYSDERERFGGAGEQRYAERGFNPDHLFFGDANRTLRRHFSSDVDAYSDFALGTFLRAVAADPLRYVRKVLFELSHVYRFTEATLYSDRPYFLVGHLAAASQRELARSDWMDGLEAGAAFRQSTRAAAERFDDPQARDWMLGGRPGGDLLRRGYRLLEAGNLPLLLAALLLGLWPQKGRGDAPLLCCAGVAALYAVASLATGALAHGLQVPRYVFAVAPLLLFSEFAAALVVVVRGESLLARTRS